MLDNHAYSLYDGQVKMTHNESKMLLISSPHQAKELQFVPMSDVKTTKYKGFSGRLRKLRKERNLSQTDLGKQVELHYTHIGRYERGTSFPSADSLKRLANALGVSADYLLEGTIQDAAKADFKDRELLKMFQEVEQLPEEDKDLIKKVLDALLTKKKLKALVG
jgi:transcriptional regulator with XRE-family HTH domain